MREDINDVLRLFMDTRLEQVHTSMPGKIDTFDADIRLAKVIPMIKMKNAKSVDIPLPAIDNVPVIFPTASAFSLTWPLKAGDGCLLLFSELGIGNYLNSNGKNVVCADDNVRHSLTDAVCVPGVYPSRGIPSSTATMSIDAQGLFEIKNQMENLGILINDLLIQIKDIDTVGTSTNQVLSPADVIAFEAIRQRFVLLLKGA